VDELHQNPAANIALPFRLTRKGAIVILKFRSPVNTPCGDNHGSAGFGPMAGIGREHAYPGSR